MSPRHGGARAGARDRVVARPTTGKRRALGQHFLRDDAVARDIVDLVAPTGADVVVEIGPGEGALTHGLAERAGRLIALEVDHALAGRLAERFARRPHVEIVIADARRYDYRALAGLRPRPEGRVLVVGSLPYSVGAAILAAVVEAAAIIARTAPMEMALMLQREVAERVAAGPGSRAYGALSVLTQLAAHARLALVVPPGAFRPPPQVESAVVHLRALAAPPVPVADPGRLRAVVRAAFAQRRKTLVNALAGGLGRPGDEMRAGLAAAGIEPMRRAETLSLEEFARLAAAL